MPYRANLRIINGDVAESLKSYMLEDHTKKDHDMVYLDTATTWEMYINSIPARDEP